MEVTLSEFAEKSGKYLSTTVLREYGHDKDVLLEFENGEVYYTVDIKKTRTRNYKYIIK